MEDFEKWYKINHKRITVYKGEGNVLDLKLGDINYSLYPIKNDDINKITTSIDSIKFIEAPVLENTKIGEITVCIKNEEIMKIEILAKKEIPRKNIIYYIKENLGIIFRKSYNMTFI